MHGRLWGLSRDPVASVSHGERLIVDVRCGDAMREENTPYGWIGNGVLDCF